MYNHNKGLSFTDRSRCASVEAAKRERIGQLPVEDNVVVDLGREAAKETAGESAGDAAGETVELQDRSLFGGLYDYQSLPFIDYPGAFVVAPAPQKRISTQTFTSVQDLGVHGVVHNTQKVHSVEPYGYDFGIGYYPLGGIDFGYGPFLPRPVKTIHSETTVHRPGYSFTSTNTEILSRDKDTKAEEAKADAQVDAKAEAQVDAKVEAQVDAKVETQVGANEDEGDQLILVS